MISTSLIGIIDGIKQGSTIYYKDHTLLLSFQGRANDIYKGVDAYYFDLEINNYIKVWHDDEPDYSQHQVREILRVSPENYLIIFHRSSWYAIWNFNCVLKSFAMINKVMNDGHLCYQDQHIFNLCLNGELQIINLMNNDQKIFHNICNFSFLEYKSRKMIQIHEKNNNKILFLISEFQRIAVLFDKKRQCERKLNLFYKDYAYRKLIQLQIIYLETHTLTELKARGQIITLSWKGINYTIEHCRMLQMRPSQKLLRRFNLRTDTQWIKFPQYIFASYTEHYSCNNETYFYNQICDITTAKVTEIFDKSKIETRPNNPILIEYLEVANQYRIHKLIFE